MERTLEPELLDHLPAGDARAVGSRADLRRVNAWMGNGRILRTELDRAFPGAPPRRIVELGCGDGSLLLKVARHFSARWPAVEIVLVDQQKLVAQETIDDYSQAGWTAHNVADDVFAWLHRAEQSDAMVANLFLHHFDEGRLRELFLAASAKTKTFIACEPRRTRLAPLAAPLLGLIGCNSVTRHDAVISIRAGFHGSELSSLWPRSPDWSLREGPAGAFSHCFVAQRLSPS